MVGITRIAGVVSNMADFYLICLSFQQLACQYVHGLLIGVCFANCNFIKRNKTKYFVYAEDVILHLIKMAEREKEIYIHT